MAQETYQADPHNPFYICTYSYSLLLQNRTQEAVNLISSLKPDDLKIPSEGRSPFFFFNHRGH